MSRSDGGAAFPTFGQSFRNEVYVRGEGMSLRDWFAGQALNGLMANSALNGEPDEAYADDAYRLADAMLRAREAK